MALAEKIAALGTRVEESSDVTNMRSALFSSVALNLVPRGRIPFGQHQGCKTSGIINVKMLTNRNLIGY